MKSTVEIIESLNYILVALHPERTELVKKFQNEIWDDESIQDEKLNEILSELAYDLDFYEPNEEWEMESINYYGDKHLEELIKLGMQKLEEYNKASLS
ncbi:hypothetical protein [Pedobacter sp. GR22-10]|uniref:hypothetical protein n=1 Tax=Pedobacter sp. GR22-10 TaxID=2994472 RepID=UPI002247E869|nr:hypothetical protein [Pedobacter sp. GR22-10]MCX2433425.1 hypothetical protein [Pedobacter sp. GR22-10]